MLREGISLVIMAGGGGTSPVERWLAAARFALALDLSARAAEIAEIKEIILVTSPRSLAAAAEFQLRPPDGTKLSLELCPEDDFHFGRTLHGLIGKYGIEALLYFGGGSGALLTRTELEQLCAQLAAAAHRGERWALLNNFYSTDFFALTPAAALLEIMPPERDNELGWLLAEEAGFTPLELERNAGTQFDVDTPTDLLVLQLYRRFYNDQLGEHTRRCLAEMSLDVRPLETALGYLVDRGAQILVAGRVASYVWRYLERETACQVRVFSEERGMRAMGRERRGMARSLLGFYLEQVGPQRFFQTLGELSELAIIDTRVLFAHLGLRPTAPDRFYSDLLQPELIADGRIREFTAAARAAEIPVILGGHSLVSGGLYALVELAWARREGRLLRRTVPLPESS